MEIWDLRQLKYIRIMGQNLPDPSYGVELPNLSALYMNAHSCTEAVFRSLPHLKKLRIAIELRPDEADETSSCLEHIGLLGELESLKCVVLNPCLRSHPFTWPHQLSNLPGGLKKLSLSGLGYSWTYMTAIASLPNLKVLKLRCSAFQGVMWSMEEYDFQSLEFLLLEDINLVQWKVYWPWIECLQHLQRLSLRHCFKLRDLSSAFYCHENLKTTEVEIVDCSPSVVASAEGINKWLAKSSKSCRQIVISSSWSR